MSLLLLQARGWSGSSNCCGSPCFGEIWGDFAPWDLSGAPRAATSLGQCRERGGSAPSEQRSFSMSNFLACRFLDKKQFLKCVVRNPSLMQ